MATAVAVAAARELWSASEDSARACPVVVKPNREGISPPVCHADHDVDAAKDDAGLPKSRCNGV